jgi:hypothetical protein
MAGTPIDLTSRSARTPQKKSPAPKEVPWGIGGHYQTKKVPDRETRKATLVRRPA